MSRSSHQKTERHLEGRRDEHGFTLIELLIVVAIIGILAALALSLYANLQARARIAKGQADTRTLASAITLYMGHCGIVPPSGAEVAGGQCNGSGLTALSVTQTNSNGLTIGPFLAPVPTAPLGWTAYTAGYVANANGTFSVTASGDGAVVTAP
jgi:prepilin-type N-terminal cleavage/methylation domain-containing protein